jgi:hypothetical protein
LTVNKKSMPQRQINLVVLALTILYVQDAVQAKILTPPYFNLATNKHIYATATCGEGKEVKNGREQYCKLTSSTNSARETESAPVQVYILKIII